MAEQQQQLNEQPHHGRGTMSAMATGSRRSLLQAAPAQQQAQFFTWDEIMRDQGDENKGGALQKAVSPPAAAARAGRRL